MFAFYGGFYGGVWCRMLGCILWLHSRVDSMVIVGLDSMVGFYGGFYGGVRPQGQGVSTDVNVISSNIKQYQGTGETRQPFRDCDGHILIMKH